MRLDRFKANTSTAGTGILIGGLLFAVGITQAGIAILIASLFALFCAVACAVVRLCWTQIKSAIPPDYQDTP